jgi:hypothetical protein
MKSKINELKLPVIRAKIENKVRNLGGVLFSRQAISVIEVFVEEINKIIRQINK